MRTPAALALVGLLAVAGCGSGESPAAPSAAASAASPGSSAPVVAPATEPTLAIGQPAPAPPGAGDPAAGCPVATAADIAARTGGLAGPLDGDLDGDGRADDVYIGAADASTGPATVVAVTAAGVLSQVEVPSRTPQPRLLGLEDADDDGRAEVFVQRSTVGPGGVSSSPVVVVAVLTGCDLALVQNVEGLPYEFQVGTTASEGDVAASRAGVGCLDGDGDGTRDLVGLAGQREVSADGSTSGIIRYTRTVVDIEDGRATNGVVSSGTLDERVPEDGRAIALLEQVTCGDDTFASAVESP